jgi:Siphovirus Gp157
MRRCSDWSAARPAELARHKVIRARLLADIPDLDAVTLANTLEGITDLREILAEVLRSALDDEALAVALSARLADLKGRLDRVETRAKRKRQLVLQAMVEGDIDKLQTEADFTASLRQGSPTLDVIAEEKIPAPYWKTQPAKLDRQGLLSALRAGTPIDGAALAAPQVQLSVRTK